MLTVRLSAADLLRAIAAAAVAAVIATQSAQAAQAKTPTPLYSFCSSGAFPDCLDGEIVSYFGGVGALIQAINGDFYGTTALGGTGGGDFGGGGYGGGTVFRITPSGKLTTLYSFCSQGGSNCPDGELPISSLVVAASGDLYGTTSGGGTGGDGTAFKITPSGNLTTVYTFCSQTDSQGNCLDGSGPSGLIQATDGNLYGTAGGGANGGGTVFRLTLDGKLTTLYSFCSQMDLQGYCLDGDGPSALIEASDGNFYGTTRGGGANASPSQIDGTVFKITPSGELTTLYSFPSPSGGYLPVAGVIQATDGNLYGTTADGGGTSSLGTLFRITPGGDLSTLYIFCSQPDCADGASPETALIQATDENLYGTAGTIFQLTLGGTFTVLCSPGTANGLMQGTGGALYGTAAGSGSNGAGAVFRLSSGLGPFVALKPTSGKAGTAVRILGADLTGASGVTFNGTAATFTVISKSEIATTVPAGAITGTVEVVTPLRTLNSNLEYIVEPKTSSPVFSPKGGTYTGSQTVSIIDRTAGSTIYYTTDGTSPATSSTALTYAGPISVNATETLKAVALGADDELSTIATAVYKVD
jgi:uncharacterized repeat protein (TIGR03803 family)